MSKERFCGLCHSQAFPEREECYDLGKKGVYHARCLFNRSPDYHNHTHYGVSDGLPKFSCEIETAARSDDDQGRTLALLYHGYISTPDGTVRTEYKSPIYRSLASAVPAMKEIGLWADKAITRPCGTHVHCNAPHVRYMATDVLECLFGHMENYWSQTERFWGRGFHDEWARDTLEFDRYAAISFYGNHPTIEYRIAKYRSYEQYMAVLRFTRAMTALLNKGYQAFARRETLYAPDSYQLAQDVLNLYCQHLDRVGLL